MHQKQQDRNKVVTFPSLAEGGGGAGAGRAIYNDTRLSRAQPWRSRYPTPHDVKEQLVRSSASDDGA